MVRREPTDYLRDIVDAADRASRFVLGMDFTAFRSDEKTVFAVVRALEIIGEAVKSVPDDAAALHTREQQLATQNSNPRNAGGGCRRCAMETTIARARPRRVMVVTGGRRWKQTARAARRDA